MRKKSLKFAALVLALSMSACGLLPEKIDETKDWSATKLYSEARDELSGGNYEKAIQYFEKLESRYPFGTYAQQAQMEIAYANYRMANQEQALAAVNRFLKLHPNHPNADYMYYLRGLINFSGKVGFLDSLTKQTPSERDPKAMREAFDAFRQLADRFPNSIYTKDAIARMKYLVSTMARYEVHVANYYYRRGAYLAAASRAQTVISQYQDAPAVEEALLIMVRAYDAMGLTDLRNDAERVMRKNFPNSVYFKGKPDKSSPWWKLW